MSAAPEAHDRVPRRPHRNWAVGNRATRWRRVHGVVRKVGGYDPVMPSIEMLPTAAAGEAHLVAALTDLVNRVYSVAEEGLWAPGAARTTEAEMAGLLAAGEIAVARQDGHGGRVVGSVRIQQLDHRLGEFG